MWQVVVLDYVEGDLCHRLAANRKVVTPFVIPKVTIASRWLHTALSVVGCRPIAGKYSNILHSVWLFVSAFIYHTHAHVLTRATGSSTHLVHMATLQVSEGVKHDRDTWWCKRERPRVCGGLVRLAQVFHRVRRTPYQ